MLNNQMFKFFKEIEPTVGETLCRLFPADEQIDLHRIASLSKHALRKASQPPSSSAAIPASHVPNSAPSSLAKARVNSPTKRDYLFRSETDKCNIGQFGPLVHLGTKLLAMFYDHNYYYYYCYYYYYRHIFCHHLDLYLLSLMEMLVLGTVIAKVLVSVMTTMSWGTAS